VKTGEGVAMSRLKMLRLAKNRIKTIFYLLKKGRIKKAYTYFWVSLFSRDSGAAILDPLYRMFPWLIRYPKAIEVEVTTRCHLRCIICEHTYWNEKGRDMSFEEFKRIIDQFPRLKWIGVTGIGSSFLNKDFMKMLNYLRSKNVFVVLYDTLTQIDENLIEETVKNELIDVLYVSIDAATKNTYEKIRVGAKFEKVISNIRTLIHAKRKFRSPIPELWFHYIICNKNAYEMSKFIDLVHSLAGDEEGVLIFWTNLLAFEDIKDLVIKLPEEIKREVIIKGKKIGIDMWWNENIEPHEPINKCVRWSEPFILVTGHVQPCCGINEANQRNFQKRSAIGNIFERPFREIWNTEYKKVIRMIHRGEVPDICRYCRIYLHDGKRQLSPLLVSRKGDLISIK
jgi:MoaA/NifB/PqqE/SkfB family radical SAM enzyme